MQLAFCVFFAMAIGRARAVGGFTEMNPLKAAMLVRSWGGLLSEVDQKVGVVPELGSTSVGVKRFGPELARRVLCKTQFDRFYEATFALATADKSSSPEAKRELIRALDIAGMKRGPLCAVYASLAAPATMSLVERRPDDIWSVLALTMNPTERNMETIVAAEAATLASLSALAADASSSLRVLSDCRDTLAGTADELSLSPEGDDDELLWYSRHLGVQGQGLPRLRIGNINMG